MCPDHQRPRGQGAMYELKSRCTDRKERSGGNCCGEDQRPFGESKTSRCRPRGAGKKKKSELTARGIHPKKVWENVSAPSQGPASANRPENVLKESPKTEGYHRTHSKPKTNHHRKKSSGCDHRSAANGKKGGKSA